MKPTWMKLRQYLETAFAAGSRPDPRTVRGQIDRGEIIGERRGTGKRAHYFVLVDAETGLEVKRHQVLATVQSSGTVPVNETAARILQKAMGG